MVFLDRLRSRASHLQEDTFALYLASRDPQTPWCAKLFIATVVAYAVSPIDLMPDFIPIVGYLDNLVLVPLGIFVEMGVGSSRPVQLPKKTKGSHLYDWNVEEQST